MNMDPPTLSSAHTASAPPLLYTPLSPTDLTSSHQRPSLQESLSFCLSYRTLGAFLNLSFLDFDQCPCLVNLRNDPIFVARFQPHAVPLKTAALSQEVSTNDPFSSGCIFSG